MNFVTFASMELDCVAASSADEPEEARLELEATEASDLVLSTGSQLEKADKAVVKGHFIQKNGVGPPNHLAVRGALSPCTVCGNVFDDMLGNKVFCWPHVRITDIMTKRWRPNNRMVLNQPNPFAGEWALYQDVYATIGSPQASFLA